MATPARTGALAAAAGFTRVAAWAPDWRGAFLSALAREVEERRFFLWKKRRLQAHLRLALRCALKSPAKPGVLHEIRCPKLLKAA
jgi:hypothetical protein